MNSLKIKTFQWVIQLLLVFPATVFGQAEYTEIGAATYRYWGFKLYEASFASTCDVGPGETDDTRKAAWDPACGYRLTLRYSRTFTPEDFSKSSTQMLRRILESGYQNIEDDFNLFSTYFEKVESGDSYTLIHTPNRGISLYLNGEKKGEVQSPEFSKAYFSIWLSEEGIDDDNALKLLGVRS